MSPLGTRARVEELAGLLEGAVSGPTTRTAGHAAVAMRLRAVAPLLEGAVSPPAEFRATLRARLVAVATVQAATLTALPAPRSTPARSGGKALGAAASWTQTRTAQRRMGVVAGLMAGVVAFTGMAVAASRSLPGQPFYGLKRGTEDVRLQLAHGDTAKGRTHLEFAATRLREVQSLAHDDVALSLGTGTRGPVAAGAFGAPARTAIDRTLADFSHETRAGQALLDRAYRASGKPEPLRILTAFSTLQKARLVAVLPDLPAGSRAVAEQALELVALVGSDAGQLLSVGRCARECLPPGGGPTLPGGTTYTPNGQPRSGQPGDPIATPSLTTPHPPSRGSLRTPTPPVPLRTHAPTILPPPLPPLPPLATIPPLP